jgi:stage II sporulation protein M
MAREIYDRIALSFAERGMLDAESSTQAWLVFRNNLFVCVLLLALGLVPFLFLPLLIICMNGVVAGAVIAVAEMPAEGSRLVFAAAGLLPHGIFELPAFFIAAGMGTFCCARLTGAALGKSRRETDALPDKEIMGLKTTALFTARMFLLVVLPLLIIAAVVEIWITPLALRSLF